jgi:hypothetical protein
MQESREQESANSAHLAGAESMPDYKGENIYISFDGDNIGNAVARAESKDDERTLAQVSQKIQSGQDLFVAFLTQHQGRLVQAGGDEGLGVCNSNCLVDLEGFRRRYKEVVGATVTVGVGRKISEATKARMLGKLRGKNQVCHFDDSTEAEIKIRSEQDDSEAKKLGQAGLLGEEKPGIPKFGIDPDSARGLDWQQEYEEPGQEEGSAEDSQGEDDTEQQYRQRLMDSVARGTADGDAGRVATTEEAGPQNEQEQQQPEEEQYVEDPWDEAKEARLEGQGQSSIQDQEEQYVEDPWNEAKDSRAQDSDRRESDQERFLRVVNQPPQEDSQYYDYTDLPFEDHQDYKSTAERIAKEEGANPNFLRLAHENLFKE